MLLDKDFRTILVSWEAKLRRGLIVAYHDHSIYTMDIRYSTVPYQVDWAQLHDLRKLDPILLLTIYCSFDGDIEY